ncbi:flagellar brake protein [Sporosarcina sp. HYO08]|uniref:flagellar brake protein n=1 Tax=Sporosarcina sp. HYO08 TaxID=1759557 RepID=UPI000796200E|nr:flagellar brake domain-containing protein [Sporosarcina sp. HYO08]KXH82037.1 hypothetical protein AU377_07230 [Sporosarcina sp. HYO08]
MLSIGSIISLVTHDQDEKKHYKSKVVDLGDQCFMIDYPIQVDTGRTAFMTNGTEITATFTDDQKDSFQFDTKIIGRLKQQIPMLTLFYPGNDKLNKIQRREYVRVETPVDVAVKYDDSYEQFVAKDISGGGIALILRDGASFSVFEQIELTIVLPFPNDEIEYVQTKGSVVRVVEKDGRTIAPIQFDEIKEDERQLIIRFCFLRQLQLRNEK